MVRARPARLAARTGPGPSAGGPSSRGAAGLGARRQLAARLGLSRPTVRQAIHSLVDKGLLVRPGCRHPGRAQQGPAPAGTQQPLRRPGGGRTAPGHEGPGQHRRSRDRR
ncbi:hypothetical protein DMH01_42355, partial [Amycolatopsis sp. WAC 04182]